MSKIFDARCSSQASATCIGVASSRFATSESVDDCDLLGGDVAQSDMTHQTLSLQVREHGERRFERPFRGVMYVEHRSQIDDVEYIHAEIAEIVVDRLGQFLTRKGRNP